MIPKSLPSDSIRKSSDVSDKIMRRREKFESLIDSI